MFAGYIEPRKIVFYRRRVPHQTCGMNWRQELPEDSQILPRKPSPPSARSFARNPAGTCAGGLSPDRPGSTCCAEINARKNPGRYLARPRANSRGDGGTCRAVASKLRKKRQALSSPTHQTPPCRPATRRSNASSGTARHPLGAFPESAS